MEPKPAVSSEDFRLLRGEVSDMKTVMAQMAKTLDRVVLLEERQQQVSATANKILEQVEAMRSAQHETDLRFAGLGDLTGRIDRLERAAHEQHIEAERAKASFKTAIWLIRGAWAVIAAGGLVVAAKVAVLF